MGRQVDGRTYEQLRGALSRLERTTLESAGSYYSAVAGKTVEARFSILSSVVIERRRVADRDQLALFETVAAAEPGVARVIIAPPIRENVAGRFTSALSVPRYLDLASPVARRLYRLLEVARAEDVLTWRVSLERLKDLLPLMQRYPSHLQRVLQPAHEMLEAAGVVRSASVRQQQREWFVDYVLAARGV
jgi:plasmid replication initiation protein